VLQRIIVRQDVHTGRHLLDVLHQVLVPLSDCQLRHIHQLVCLEVKDIAPLPMQHRAVEPSFWYARPCIANGNAELACVTAGAAAAGRACWREAGPPADR